jgi:rRNA pseudouridine-1189 N-methylase Emg1 (Nep1/Mra1 family)
MEIENKLCLLKNRSLQTSTRLTLVEEVTEYIYKLTNQVEKEVMIVFDLAGEVMELKQEIEKLNDKLIKTGFVIVDQNKEIEKYRYQLGLRSDYKPEETE